MRHWCMNHWSSNLCHHTYYNNEYILSNIMVDGKYYSTYGELKEKDNKWDKLK